MVIQHLKCCFFASLCGNFHILFSSGGAIGLIVTRIAIGLTQGPLIPSIASIMTAWIPVEERTRCCAIAFMGIHVKKNEMASLHVNENTRFHSSLFTGWELCIYVHCWNRIASQQSLGCHILWFGCHGYSHCYYCCML